MKKTILILLTISSITLLAAEEPSQPESIEQAIFRKKRSSLRLNTGYYPINVQDGNSEPMHYSKTYFNYKQNEDGSITISAHSKKYGYTISSYRHAVTLSARDLAHLEALHHCYSNPECDPRYCAQTAGKTVANMYNEIKVIIPLFFEYLGQLRNQQAQS